MAKTAQAVTTRTAQTTARIYSRLKQISSAAVYTGPKKKGVRRVRSEAYARFDSHLVKCLKGLDVAPQQHQEAHLAVCLSPLYVIRQCQ